MVARYDIESGYGEVSPYMSEQELGDYVLYEDYKKLEIRIKELEERITLYGWQIEAQRNRNY